MPAKKAAPERALVLRTCDANLRSYEGFQWPESGPVECPKWSPEPRCGYGLHGLLWGEGDGNLLSWEADAKWLVVEVDADAIVDLGRKVKFPRGVVVYCGDRKGATDFIIDRAPEKIVVGAIRVAGDYGTATVGYRGTATAGYGGTAKAGYAGTATAGDYGIAATVGYRGLAMAGDCGRLQIEYWDNKVDRSRLAVAYVGENGIKPHTPYRVDDKGRFVEVER